MRLHMYSVQVYCTRTVHKCTRGSPVGYFHHFAQFWYKVQVRIRILIRLNELILSFWPSCSSLCSAVRLPPSPPPLSRAVKLIALWKHVAFHLHWESLSGRKAHSAFYPALQPAPSMTSTQPSSSPLRRSTQFHNANLCREIRKKSCIDSSNYFWYLEGFVSSPILFARGPRSVRSYRNALYRSLLTACCQALHPFFLFFFILVSDIEQRQQRCIALGETQQSRVVLLNPGSWSSKAEIKQCLDDLVNTPACEC